MRLSIVCSFRVFVVDVSIVSKREFVVKVGFVFLEILVKHDGDCRRVVKALVDIDAQVGIEKPVLPKPSVVPMDTTEDFRLVLAGGLLVEGFLNHFVADLVDCSQSGTFAINHSHLVFLSFDGCIIAHPIWECNGKNKIISFSIISLLIENPAKF